MSFLAGRWVIVFTLVFIRKNYTPYVFCAFAGVGSGLYCLGVLVSLWCVVSTPL